MSKNAGCGAVGSALRSGRRGRRFESCHPDKIFENRKNFFLSFQNYYFKLLVFIREFWHNICNFVAKLFII